MPSPLAQTVGRRKSSVARVRIYDGTGSMSLNGRPIENYFPNMAQRIRILEPMRAAGMEAATTSPPPSRGAASPGSPMRCGWASPERWFQ
jgi:hypothetical protein